MDQHSVGKEICLWQLGKYSNVIIVLREVIVIITDIDTGDHFMGLPASFQRLKAVDMTGKLYQKWWKSEPPLDVRYPFQTWTEGNGTEVPDVTGQFEEAVSVYNAHASKLNGPTGVKLLDLKNKKISPKGDVLYCKKHDQYAITDNECLMCGIPILQRA